MRSRAAGGGGRYLQLVDSLRWALGQAMVESAFATSDKRQICDRLKESARLAVCVCVVSMRICVAVVSFDT